MLRIVSARQFRVAFTTLDESVLVYSKGHIVGTWHPGYKDPAAASVVTAPMPIVEAVIKAGDTAERSFNSRPFTPVPKGK